jgi:hypothetical protein
MSPRPKGREERCDRPVALNRLAQADAFLLAATLVIEDDTDSANPGVAASLAVLAGIAASDAACCARLGSRARGQAHGEAVALLRTVAPHGAAMAKDLERLVARKDAAQYGASLISAAETTRMVSWATRLVQRARAAVEA